MMKVWDNNEKVQCTICGGRYTRCNQCNHFRTILHQNAVIKAQAAEGKDVLPVTSTECKVCGGRYMKTSEKEHMNTKKHHKAQLELDYDK